MRRRYLIKVSSLVAFPVLLATVILAINSSFQMAVAQQEQDEATNQLRELARASADLTL
jgi:hypothetical protein